MYRFLNWVERYGNKIPNPSLMFLGLSLFVILLSWLLGSIEWQALHPVKQTNIIVNSLVSAEGLRFVLTSMVSNFINFAPVGIVLVAMLGLGIAEKSGLMNFLLLKLVGISQQKGLTFLVAFSGIMSSMASDAGYVVLLPISALLFHQAGRPPIAGIATAFAGVSAGYAANLFVGPFDALLSGISTSAAQIINPNAEVAVTSNWFFLIFSTFLLSIIITFITETRQWQKLVNTTSSADEPAATAAQNGRGLLSFSFFFLAIVALFTFPDNAPLRNPETGSLTQSPFIDGIVIIIGIYFAGLGIVFGFNNQTFKESADIIKAMENTMASLSGYLVLMFFAAQFVAYFNWSQIGLIISIKGAGFLTSLAISEFTILIIFVLITAFINLFIGSGSAKWALIAPVFLPMLMITGISPEVTQMAYRIGDSSTNIISPMMPYFALALSFLQKHHHEAGMGTLLSAMIPYSLGILVIWLVVFLIWLALGIPLGLQ